MSERSDGANMVEVATAVVISVAVAVAVAAKAAHYTQAGDPLRQQEDRVHGAALSWHAAGLGGAVRSVAPAQGGQTIAGSFAETFKDFPQVQKPNNFTIDDALAKMAEASGGG